MVDQTLPTPAAKLIKPDGRPDDIWYQCLSLMWKAFNALTTTQASDVAALQASVVSLQAADAALQASITALQSSVTSLQGISGSTTYDPPNLGDGAGATTTVTVTGAALGNYAIAAFSLDLQGITVTAWVSSANTVSVRFQNESGGTLNLGSGTLTARVTT